jgi:hypothetical protein
MAGAIKPRVTRCVCHNIEIVILYNPWRRKRVWVFLRDSQGKTIWDGNPIYSKAVHRRHWPWKYMQLRKEMPTYDAVGSGAAPIPEEELPKMGEPFKFPSRDKWEWKDAKKRTVFEWEKD